MLNERGICLNPTTEQAYRLLFDADKFIFVCADVKQVSSNRLFTIEQASKHEKHYYMAVNSIWGEFDEWNRPRRSQDYCTAFTNFLIENDVDTLEEQMEKAKAINMPFTTAIFSGKKSVHYVVHIGGISTRAEYAAMHKCLLLAYGAGADCSTKDPARLTRAPNVFRDNGQKQCLLACWKRWSLVDVIAWLASRNVSYEAVLQAHDSASSTSKQVRTTTWDGWLPVWNTDDMPDEGCRHHSILCLTGELVVLGVPEDIINDVVYDHCSWWFDGERLSNLREEISACHKFITK